MHIKSVALFFYVVCLTSCVVVPAERSLISTKGTISIELLEAFSKSAITCGFPETRNNTYFSGITEIYISAKTTPNNLTIVLLKNVRTNELQIVESDGRQNIRDGFTDSDLREFACFEDELKRQLPDSFNWR